MNIIFLLSLFIVDYRGEKIAAFMIGGKTMLCLPQAFELFLKNLGMLWPVLISMYSHDTRFYQCFGSGSVLIWLSWIWIRIRIGNADPEPVGRNKF
jgi:hypothetical protein